MKNKLTKIIIFSLIATIMFSFCMPIVVNATDVAGISIEDGKIGADSNGEFNTLLINILKLIRTIGIGIGICVIAYLGSKYITGSVEEKADYKKSFIPLIVGIVVLMGTLQIASMLFSLGSGGSAS